MHFTHRLQTCITQLDPDARHKGFAINTVGDFYIEHQVSLWEWHDTIRGNRLSSGRWRGGKDGYVIYNYSVVERMMCSYWEPLV